MTRRRVTLIIDDVKFFDQASSIPRTVLGDRFIELCLTPDRPLLQVALLALYGIEVVAVEETE